MDSAIPRFKLLIWTIRAITYKSSLTELYEDFFFNIL